MEGDTQDMYVAVKNTQISQPSTSVVTETSPSGSILDGTSTLGRLSLSPVNVNPLRRGLTRNSIRERSGGADTHQVNMIEDGLQIVVLVNDTDSLYHSLTKEWKTALTPSVKRPIIFQLQQVKVCFHCFCAVRYISWFRQCQRAHIGHGLSVDCQPHHQYPATSFVHM